MVIIFIENSDISGDIDDVDYGESNTKYFTSMVVEHILLPAPVYLYANNNNVYFQPSEGILPFHSPRQS